MKRSFLLMAAVAALTPFQREIHGTNQRSLIDIPSKPETDEYYATKAREKRERKANRKARQ